MLIADISAGFASYNAFNVKLGIATIKINIKICK